MPQDRISDPVTTVVHYPYLLDPSEHPDYERYHVRMPTWETFENRTQLTTLRGFSVQNGKLVAFREELDRYVNAGLGRVIWPFYTTVLAQNFWDLVEEVRRRKLWLFDFWGYVPGSPLEGSWCNYQTPAGMVERLERELGDRFLGFDNGEQDGRYIGRFAHQQCPSPQDRTRQYLNFQRHFQRLCDDLGNHMCTLVSLCFGHYFIKEGNHTLIGAETAQALPNSQVYYAFIRGAGKQYGVLWFGNASVWNRWGWKVYESSGIDPGGLKWGPDAGTSTALLKRLIYSHWMYNCVAIGFESSYFGADGQLSPIGKIQAAMGRFIEEHGSPGTMHAPVALMLDHYAGWAMPRHLYSGSGYYGDTSYQVWGGIPYGAGDYLTHEVLSLAYPGYVDAGYYRDERGFLSPTPWGDMMDCLLSDAAPWVLRQYGLIVVAGDLSDGNAGTETHDTLNAFMSSGGHVVATAENARRLWPELGIGEATRVPAGTSVRFERTGEVFEEPLAFDLHTISATPDEMVAEAVLQPGSQPAVVRFTRGDGLLTVVLSPFGLNAEPTVSGPIPNEAERAFPCPFVMLDHVQRVLGDAFATQQVFSVGEGLGFVTCRRKEGEYTIGLFNNSLDPRSFQIRSLAGVIEEIREIPLDQSEKGQPGYWPNGIQHDGGVSDETTIAGNDVRIFQVKLTKEAVRALPHVAPPERPRNRFLRLPRGTGDVKEAILRMPTFFQHFDGVLLDWNALHARDVNILRDETRWIGRQKLRIAVDFSSGCNLFPDLQMLDTFLPAWERTRAVFDDVFGKMEVLGSRDAVLELHVGPENEVSHERARERFLVCVREICQAAATRSVTVHLRPHPHKFCPNNAAMRQFVNEVGASNLRVAVDFGHGAQSEKPEAPDFSGASFVLVSAPLFDLYGRPFDAHLPLSGSALDLSLLAGVPAEAVIVYDAEYSGWDDIYRDTKAIEEATRSAKT